MDDSELEFTTMEEPEIPAIKTRGNRATLLATRIGRLAGQLEAFRHSEDPLVEPWLQIMASGEAIAGAWLSEWDVDSRSFFLFTLGDVRPKYETVGLNYAVALRSASLQVLRTRRGAEDFPALASRLRTTSAAALAESFMLEWTRYESALEAEGLPAAAALIAAWHRWEKEFYDRAAEEHETLSMFPEKGMPGVVTRVAAPWAIRAALGGRFPALPFCAGIKGRGLEYRKAIVKGGEDWILLFLDILLKNATRAIEMRRNLELVVEMTKRRSRSAHGRARKHDEAFAYFLASQPVLDSESVMKALKLSGRGALDVIARSEASQIIRPLGERQRYKTWICDQLAGVLDI
jgi:hypothetical protein